MLELQYFALCQKLLQHNYLRSNKYKLTVRGFQGATTDPMAIHNQMNFTTKDNNNNALTDDNNCAGPEKPSRRMVVS